MCKTSKTKKINNRLKKVDEETLFKLYNVLPYKCQSCVFNSNCVEIQGMNDTKDCQNYEMAIELNYLIEKMKDLNVNLDSFCEKFNLKKPYLIEMLKGHILLNYKYYIAILNRIHVIDEFEEYKDRFKNNFENNKDEYRFELEVKEKEVNTSNE